MNTNYFLKLVSILVITFFCLPIIKAQSYDIYVLDKKNGTTKRLTTNSGGDEWNVSWSNNGKEIVYDFFSNGVQNIYITQLASGATRQLAGAENGNDAVWSPNGKTIAFDRWEDLYGIGWWSQNIHLTSPEGGATPPFRFNAHHATWNPRSNKIAFDDNYGYIATKDINTGIETFVTSFGSRPAWSPNGQYIAFEGWSWLGAGIWVVRVDTSGYPLSVPVQVATSGFAPTWSNDNKEIVFMDWPTGDPDLYSTPVGGGVATRIAGRVGGFEHGDYDPAFSNNGQYIAWSSFTDASSILVKQPGNSELIETTIKQQNLVNGLALDQNSPNPFKNYTTIPFRVSKESRVVITVYNSIGQKIKTLVNADYKAGVYITSWDGSDKNNSLMPKGIYVCEMRVGNNLQIKKLAKN